MSIGSFFKKATKAVTKNIVPGLSGAGAGALIGSIVPGIGTLVGAGIGGAAGIGLGYLQDQQVKAQNKANQQAVNAANAYDMYTWDLANQYNDPKAQAQRLLDAGFNPYAPGAIDAGNASGTAGSNGVAQRSVANKAALGMQFAQLGANISNTMANTDYTMLQSKALDHNLTWAVDHDLPVGQQTDWEKDVYRTSKDFGKNVFDKLTNWWNNKSSSAKSYRERNADRSTWDLVKEQAADMYQRYKFW